jgi:tRNA pseudouridine13 synthase
MLERNSDTRLSELRKLYEDAAERGGVSLGAAHHGVEEFSMHCFTGDLRRAVVRPRALAYHFVQHRSLDDEIVSPDLQHVSPGSAFNVHEASDSAAVPQDARRKYSVSSQGAAKLAESATSQDGAQQGDVPADAVTGLAGAETSDGGHSVTSALPPPPTRPLKDAYGNAEDSTYVMHQDGSYLSLVMTFALPASSYATMLIRELLKSSTATAVHKAASAAQRGGMPFSTYKCLVLCTAAPLPALLCFCSCTCDQEWTLYGRSNCPAQICIGLDLVQVKAQCHETSN